MNLCMIDFNNEVGFVFSGANTNVESIFSADANCEVLADYLYSAYGEVMMQSGELAQKNPMRFSTRYAEDTSLYYYGYRHYSPKLRKWTSNEPLGESESRNLNTFCKNNPINFIDILGSAPVMWAENNMSPKELSEKISREQQMGDQEVCGYICQECKNGELGGVYATIFYGQRHTGTCFPNDAPCNIGDVKLRIWHTHPSGKLPDGSSRGENFSKEDKDFAQKNNLPIDLLTPKGTFKTYNPRSFLKKIFTPFFL